MILFTGVALVFMAPVPFCTTAIKGLRDVSRMQILMIIVC